jgi:hypothetical protein
VICNKHAGHPTGTRYGPAINIGNSSSSYIEAMKFASFAWDGAVVVVRISILPGPKCYSLGYAG